MAKFDIGEWVRKGNRKGVICGKKGRQVVVRWVGTDRGEAVSPRSLRATSKPWALALEGSLDRDLTSTRSAERVLRTWLGAEGVQLAYKTVHCLEDIRIVGRAIGKNVPPFIYISCHGDHDGRRPYLIFSPTSRKRDRVYLDNDDTAAVFKEVFRGRPILFSACNLGKYEKPIGEFRRKAGLGRVAVYTREISDSEGLLFELMVYHGILNRHWKFETAINRATNSMATLGIRGGVGRGQAFVRVV